jgi:hypothetical protein
LTTSTVVSDRDRPVFKEVIEITPQMVRAGEVLLDEYDPDYSNSAKYLKAIFSAMEAARRPTQESISERGD